MTDDIVVRLRSEKEYCAGCNEFPCRKQVGRYAVAATPADCDCECHGLARAAAAEIERLRAQLAELLPFAHGDAKSGASVAYWPGGHDCEPICEDCQWHLDSVALLARIEAGEFGPLNNSW